MLSGSTHRSTQAGCFPIGRCLCHMKTIHVHVRGALGVKMSDPCGVNSLVLQAFSPVSGRKNVVSIIRQLYPFVYSDTCRNSLFQFPQESVYTYSSRHLLLVFIQQHVQFGYSACLLRKVSEMTSFPYFIIILSINKAADVQQPGVTENNDDATTTPTEARHFKCCQLN